MGGADICVVGASNMDLISYTPRLPVLGETLHGTRFAMGFGGKGANQAVMAAKLGGKVAMVTKLGQDAFGESTLKNFEQWGVDTRNVTFTVKAFSGVAPIAVDPGGNNSIIIVTGANDCLTLEDIENAREAISGARVLIAQLEVPLEISLAALKIAREAGVRTLFNPAPARESLPAEAYALSDIFCPNETETRILTGQSVRTLEEAEAAANTLLARGAKSVILTLGERGSLLVEAGGKATHLPVEPVNAVDTTGAGDAFVGSLAHFLAKGLALAEAVRRANLVASKSVLAHGTQSSFPVADGLAPELLETGPEPSATETAPPAMTAAQLAQTIDHTVLKANATPADMDTLCAEALAWHFKSVCVNSWHVPYVAEKLRGSDVLVCAVVGFPLGAMSTGAKAEEARLTALAGAQELDMVINIGALKSRDSDTVLADIEAVRQAAPAPVVLKVIIETCLLTDAEKVLACQAAQKAGADFVKTSTGFSTGGATEKDVALMRRTVGDSMGVKASGGIKTADDALKMIRAGASRIGAGAGVAIVRSL